MWVLAILPKLNRMLGPLQSQIGIQSEEKMALSIKKTKSGILIPNTPVKPRANLSNTLNKYFSISEENIVTDQIKLMLRESLNIKGRTDVRRLEYFVVYQMDAETMEKQISKIHIRHKITKQFVVMTASEIEMTGVMLLEFFDYVNTNGASEIQDQGKILELV